MGFKKLHARQLPHEAEGRPAPDTYREAVVEALRWSAQSRASLAGLPQHFAMKRGSGAVMLALEELVEEGLVEQFPDGDNGAGQPIEMYRLTDKGWGDEERE